MEISKNNNKVIKDRILKEIRYFFEHEKEENCYKPVRVSNFFGITIILNMEVNVIEIKHYQLNSILIKLDNI